MLFIFLIAFVTAVSANTLRFDIVNSEHDGEWSAYKLTFSKKYPSQLHETVRRFQWAKNLQLIQKHNLEADLGKHTYYMGVNEYTDLSDEEFKARFACLLSNTTTEGGSTFLPPNNVVLPSEVDWRSKGYVTPVKDQGNCGSCWAFSTTGSVEGQHFRKTGKLTSLSEQNLVDCSRLYGNHGCSGGLSVFAYRYIFENNGIDTEASYPYEAEDSYCRFKPANVGATVSGYKLIPPGKELMLQAAVASVGPISVAIDASQPSFRHYSRGVYNEPHCRTRMLDHAVLVVGYDTEDGNDYWLVKNSWGRGWGKDGYIKMSRNKGNQCGIASDASFPVV